MSVLHRTARSPTDASGTGAGLVSPAARRLRGSRWRDPRIWLGAALVLASIVVGARVLAAADDTVAIWALRGDLASGITVDSGDVAAVDIHFADASDASRYVSAEEPLPAGLHLVRDVGAGELLALSALSDDATTAPAQLPLAVGPAGMPPDLAAGNRVDLWAVPADDGARTGAQQPVVRVLTEVTVVSVASAGPAGAGSDRQVLVTLPPDADVADVLASLRSSDVVLIRAGG
ncbi:MAG: hypothetical protein M3Q82_03975 [Actinomycetota bacterium]|nr:hypothetical protein [Actinomycetota bacterium]